MRMPKGHVSVCLRVHKHWHVWMNREGSLPLLTIVSVVTRNYCCVCKQTPLLEDTDYVCSAVEMLRQDHSEARASGGRGQVKSVCWARKRPVGVGGARTLVLGSRGSELPRSWQQLIIRNH